MSTRKLRVKQLTAETVTLPPTEWFVKEVNWLLDQKTFQDNYCLLYTSDAADE